MADFTLADALSQSRDNLLAIAALAIDDVSAAYGYPSARSNTANIFELLLKDYSETLTASDGNVQRYTFGAELRLRVDVWLAGYDGQLYERAAWQYLPSAAQYFVEHRGLNASGAAGQRPPWLDPANTHVTRGRVVAQDEHVWVVFNWTLVFNTIFQRCGL